jgi:hypothetical protein
LDIVYVYGIPVLIALVCVLIYVQRIARRQKEKRQGRSTGRQKPKYEPPSISQRSEMRSGESAVTVMAEIQRTHSGSPRLPTEPKKAAGPDSRTRTTRRDKR